MNIVFDTRESALISAFSNLVADSNLAKEVKPLDLGDVLLEYQGTPLVLFERKSLSDLIASIKDKRYEEQSYRLFKSDNPIAPHNVVYIIEGMFSQIRTPVEKKMVLSAITSLSMFKGASVLRTCSVNETAELVFSMATKLEKELTKGKTLFYGQEKVSSIPVDTILTKEGNEVTSTEPVSEKANVEYCSVVKKVKRDNITPANIGEIILCQIPGISSTTAIELMKPYKTFREFMNAIHEHPELLTQIKINGRKLGKNIVENIQAYLISSEESK